MDNEKLNKAPERIYLQTCGDYKSASKSGELTWCEDKINDDDDEYIRADIKPKVKPLEWSDCDGDAVADSIFGTHAIIYDDEYGYTVLLNDAGDPYVSYDHPELGFETEEDAKNAIFQGVERRILSALEADA